MKIKRLKRPAQIAAGMVTCAFLGGLVSDIAVSFADNLASTSTVTSGGLVLPYEGFLMLDSNPLNVQGQEMQFELYETPTAGTAQWVETQMVNVYNGRFSAAIGTGSKVSSEPAAATFDQVILDAEQLYLSIKVKDSNNVFVELSGRQAIEAAPYAAWSANSADLSVAGKLDVAGNADIKGRLDVGGEVVTPSAVRAGSVVAPTVTSSGLIQGGSMNAGANITSVNGNITGVLSANGINTDSIRANALSRMAGGLAVDSTLQFTGNDFRMGPNLRGDVGRAIVHWINDSLVFNFENDFTGGTIINSNLNVTGNVTGLTATMTGCGWVYSGCNSDGTGRFFDRHNGVNCPTNKVMVDYDVNTARCAPNQFSIGLNCCNITVQ